MLCVGISGGFNLIHENVYRFGYGISHDGGAALVEDGDVVLAIEEERLNRIKHSNKFPEQALRFCLDRRGARVEDVDRFAFYMREDCCNRILSRMLRQEDADARARSDARGILCDRLQHTFKRDIAPERIAFVPHHYAHAASAFELSGFDRSLILAVDGVGDFLSGLLATADVSAAEFEERKQFGVKQSLGAFYFTVTRLLGFSYFDEYKVMGLAPYGDPARYRPAMRALYDLWPDGDYTLRLDDMAASLTRLVAPRRHGEAIAQEHIDLAASLQGALEEIVLHVLGHYGRVTGERQLCLAGGVAQNCSMNGRILYSGLFDSVFVQPASHDAGCAVGAALAASRPSASRRARTQLRDVFWGGDIGSDRDTECALERWKAFISYERVPDIARRSAELLAHGAVLAWMQGRSEFGPRALGGRSILADPRPADNRERINSIIKKREAFRPFAPAILEEDLHDYFDVPPGRGSFAFMSFVARVRQDRRALLGAVTHVDGSARVQTVSRDANPRFWLLLRRFKELTGIPCLLNTSFNDNAEPIVECVEDGLVTCLTTDLNYLAVGDWLVTKRRVDWTSLTGLQITLPLHVQLVQERGFNRPGEATIRCEMRSTHDARFRHPISPALYRILTLAHEQPGGGVTLQKHALSESAMRTLASDLLQVWQRHLVRLSPPSVSASTHHSAVTV